VGGRVLARYGDESPAWIEKPFGQGRVVYVGHRPGLTYSSRAVVLGGMENVWADAPRVPLIQPLSDLRVARELILSEPVVMALPLSTDSGTALVLCNMRPYAMENVDIDLAEPAAPYSVQVFSGYELEDLPSRFEDGRLRMTLPALDVEEGQIIIVRRKPAPRDTRIEDLRARVEKNLADSDWRGRSAGAWLAGFFPGWKLDDRVAPLLVHEQPEVRRAAAEALGRMGSGGGADRVARALGREKDPHARVDMLAALFALRGGNAVDTAVDMLNDSDAFVRAGALESLLDYASGGAEAVESLRALDLDDKLLEFGMEQRDARAFDAALRLYGRVAPEAAVELSLELAASNEPGVRGGDVGGGSVVRGQERLLALLAVPAVLDAYIAAACSGGPGIPPEASLLRRSPALAGRILENLGEVTDVWTLLVQADPDFARKLFARREELPARLRGYVYIVLEKVFKAHLGFDELGWAAWLETESRHETARN